ncbi:MAG: hypothetical protein ACJAXL_001400, partial [Alphaproteobacteria bacterium]
MVFYSQNIGCDFKKHKLSVDISLINEVI